MSGSVRGTLLYLHPFAEEMHKSRRMAALQARAFATAGFAVLQIDLTGCGDSDGDFANATWSRWCDDAAMAVSWMQTRNNQPVMGWGLRLGASLAVDVQRRLHLFSRLILWQPVISGDIFLNQFLRLKLASDMLAAVESPISAKSLRAALAAGNIVEIAGYRLTPQLADELTVLKLIEPVPMCSVDWLEVTSDSGTLSPASQRVIDAWQDAGNVVRSRTVTGDPFWVTQEISECPDLLSATLASVSNA